MSSPSATEGAWELATVSQDAGISETPVRDSSDSHPLMRKFQDTLQKHLLKHRENLLIEQQEMMKEFRLKKKEREEFGVRLFELQKAIAKQQTNLEGLAQLYQTTEPQRAVLEENLAKVKSLLSRIEEMVRLERKDELTLLRKIDVLNCQCHKLTDLKDSLKSDVTALRLSTRKSSTSFTLLENNKEKQDEHINRLLLAVHSGEDKLVTYKTQIETLNEEIATMKTTLSMAKMEIETIDFESKALLEQWHKSLDKMRTRDETLSTLQESFLILEELLKVSRSELKSFEKSVSKEEEVSRKLHSVHLSLDTKVEVLSKQLAENVERRQALKLELTTLRCDVEEIQRSIAVQTQDKNAKEVELSVATKSLQEVINEKHRLQDDLREQYLSYNFSDKSLQTILKESVKSREQWKAIQSTKNRCQSELAKVQTNKNEQLDRLDQLEEECQVLQGLAPVLDQRNRDREAYARKLTQTIDRRQQEINKIRFKLDTFINQTGAPDQGPIELQIAHLQRCLAERVAESHVLQGLWLRQQTSLVGFSQRKEQCLQEMRHLQSQAFIYTQKKMQLEGEIENASDVCSALQRRIENIHVVISKLNLQSFRDHAQEESLRSVTILSEEDLFSTLKAREEDLLKVRERSEALREEEDDVSQKLLDAENELSLWQQKYVLMKQVKCAVDSEYKKGEIRDLQNNLHKMQVQYSGLCKQHGRLAQGMEKAVQRWDVLLEKGERRIVGASSSAGTSANVKSLLQRQVDEATARIKLTVKETGMVEEDIRNILAQQDELNREIEEKKTLVQRFGISADKLQTAVESKGEDRIKKFEEIVTKQKQARSYQGMEKNTYKTLCETRDTLDFELDKHTTYSRQLIQVTGKLAENFPSAAAQLNQIRLRHFAQVSALGIQV